jgi:site-specific recombinase XerD
MGGLPRDLSTTSVKCTIKSAAKRDRLSPSIVIEFSGHSLRVSAAQDLLRKGFDTAAIMRAGGWKPLNTLSRYLEKAEHNVWAYAPEKPSSNIFSALTLLG